MKKHVTIENEVPRTAGGRKLFPVNMLIFTHLTLANFVAIASQDASSISPWGSTNLTPLSGSSLCEAVIITPIMARLV